MKKAKRKFDLSIIEIMLIVTIIGIIAAIAIPAYQSYMHRQERAAQFKERYVAPTYGSCRVAHVAYMELRLTCANGVLAALKELKEVNPQIERFTITYDLDHETEFTVKPVEQ